MQTKSMFILLIITILFQSLYGSDYSEIYKSKPNGVYININSSTCTACLATLVNDLSIKLDEKKIYYVVDFYAKSKFEFSKYKSLFNCEINFIKLTENNKSKSKYLIKYNDYYMISDLHQHLSTEDILDKALKKLKIVKLNSDISETIYSINNTTTVNDRVIYFSDQFSGNVYLYNSETNQIQLQNYKLDSLKTHCLEESRNNLPYVWENGHTDTADFYRGLTERMNKLQRINSFSVKKDEVSLLFSFITKSITVYNAEKEERSLVSRYSEFIYNFQKTKLEELKLDKFNSFHYDKEYSFYFKNNNWEIGVTSKDSVIKVIKTLKSFKKLYGLKEDILIIDSNLTYLLNPITEEIKKYDLILNRENQLIPMYKSDSGIYSILDEENTIQINSYKFGNGVDESNYIINKNVLGQENYLGILGIKELENSILVTLLTEEQNIYRISFEN